MASRVIPATMRQIIVKTLGNDLRVNTELATVAVPKPGKSEVLIKTKYVGVNASDVLFSSGAYKPGVPPPYPAGLEALGEVVAVGNESKLKIGQNVVAFHFGCFGEYVVLPDAAAIPVPSDDPAFLSLGLSGTTASIALEKKGEIKSGETVLVTGAAGGTGQFAVQLAKLAGCKVLGTCSSEEKAAFLKSLGCDRPIIYTKESVDEVLKKECPNGVDVVYECIGNEMFDTALQNIAVYGRIIVIGAISGYEGAGAVTDKVKSQLPIAFMLLNKSADVRGFFLVNYPHEIGRHVDILARHYTSGQIKAATDQGKGSDKGPFKGLEKVYDAVDYMYAKKNKGKIIVAL